MAEITIPVVLLLLLLWKAEATYVPGLYVFGDSTADVGNNNYLPGNAGSKANYPHNGIDYPGGVPTGRFSNGYIGVDFMAMMMGFSQSPPPALSITDVNQELRGVNYASGGSGIFDATGANVTLSINEQIMLFENTARRLVGARGSGGAQFFLSRSIFLFSTANNDLFSYFSTFGNTNDTQKDQFISLITDTFRDQLKRVYDLGARKFGVAGVGLIGCSPALRRLTPNNICIEELNDLARRFNNAMLGKLSQLSSKNQGMKYSYYNSYAGSTTILANPFLFGFTNTTSACCGTGTLNAETPCLPTATYCANRNQYLSWDYVHPTQAAYRVISIFWYFGSRTFTVPINLFQLALS